MSSNISKRLTFIAGENSLQNDTAAVASACENKENSSARFPDKLHRILTDEKWNHIITFTGDGRSWKVLNKKLLEKEILPIYFRTKKYRSFTRNVVGWGFKREGKANYYHKLFHRDRPEQCIDMIRISASKSALINKLELQKSLGSASQSSTLESGPGRFSACFAGINKNSCNHYDPRMLGVFSSTSAFTPLSSQSKCRLPDSYPSQDINPNVTLPSMSYNHHAINLTTTLMQQNKVDPLALLPAGVYAHLTKHDLNSRGIERHSFLHGDQQNSLNNNSLAFPPQSSHMKYRLPGTYPSQDINPSITLPSISCNHHAIKFTTALMQQNKVDPLALLPAGTQAHLREHDLNSRGIERDSCVHGDQQNCPNHNSLQYITDHHNLLPTKESHLN